ncbi:MAG: Lrp/AsnC ligand binding domain-containing protein [Chloroflexi bacterium]|nr:Lrp/AsnC ligand binding domain-containing protein [Chloroflexota bacterium]
MPVNAIVLVTVERGKINDVAQSIVDIDGVSDVFSIAGRYDLVAILRVQSNEEIADIVTGAIRAIPHITNTETLIAFKAYAKSDLDAAFSIGNEEVADR